MQAHLTPEFGDAATKSSAARRITYGEDPQPTQPHFTDTPQPFEVVRLLRFIDKDGILWVEAELGATDSARAFNCMEARIQAHFPNPSPATTLLWDDVSDGVTLAEEHSRRVPATVALMVRRHMQGHSIFWGACVPRAPVIVTPRDYPIICYKLCHCPSKAMPRRRVWYWCDFCELDAGDCACRNLHDLPSTNPCAYTLCDHCYGQVKPPTHDAVLRPIGRVSKRLRLK